jgi:SAM-dependent methyltransferase
MHVDVTRLRDFYARPLGAVVRRLIGHRIRSRWRDTTGLVVAGLGFATPYLGVYRGEAQSVLALMPAGQGALVWPRHGPSLSALVDEEALPIVDNSIDRLLVVHCFEGAERVRPVLRELWRVLTPEGRLMLVVPNRLSMWARAEKTPFGQGRPYTRGQLDTLLTDAMFAPTDWGWALHVPPVEGGMLLRSAVAFERIGGRVWPALGGVVLVEARKELVAPSGGKAVRIRAQQGLVVAPGQATTARGKDVRSGPATKDENGLLAQQVLKPK